MPSILINFIYLSGFAIIGLSIGWWLRGHSRKVKAARSGENTDAQAAELENTRQKTEEAIHRVQQLTQDIAFDVEEHSEHVLEANHILQETEASDTEAMLATMAKIVQANEQLQSQLDAAEEKLNAQAAQMASHAAEARTDALTSIANRRAFDAELAEAENAFRFDGQTSCVMMMDVDHFKKFNDTHGHQAGDEVLKHVAKSLRRKVKRDGLVARYGGEEFAVIYRNLSLEKCRAKAEQARDSIGQINIEFEGKELHVNASAGLAGMLQGELSSDLIKRADDALYEAKAAGRDQGYYHDGDKCHPLDKVETPARPKAVREAIDTAPETAIEQSVSDLVNSSQIADTKVETPATDKVETAQASQSTPQPTSPVVAEPEAELPAVERSDWKAEVSNRQEFCEDLTRRIAEWKRGGRSMSIILLHIDDLTNIVAERGEGGLEAVLKTTAQFLKASMRDMDHVARFDDGTFALMLPGSAAHDAEAVAQRLRLAISRCQVPLPEGELRFTVSVGISGLQTGDTVGSILARTQASLNAAVSLGGNQCHLDCRMPV